MIPSFRLGSKQPIPYTKDDQKKREVHDWNAANEGQSLNRKSLCWAKRRGKRWVDEGAYSDSLSKGTGKIVFTDFTLVHGPRGFGQLKTAFWRKGSVQEGLLWKEPERGSKPKDGSSSIFFRRREESEGEEGGLGKARVVPFRGGGGRSGL